jgi:putative ABC transport system substrate-binding protein
VKRREFITLLGGAAAAWPLAARAQQAVVPEIGFLHGASPVAWTDQLRGFHRGLKDAGFVEGENVAIVYRWAEGQYDRLPALVADLTRRQVTVLVAITTLGDLRRRRQRRRSRSSSSPPKTRSRSVLSPASPGRAAI